MHNFWEGVHLNKYTSLLHTQHTIYSSYFYSKFECLDITKIYLCWNIDMSVGKLSKGINFPDGLTNNNIVRWTSDCFFRYYNITHLVKHKKKNITRFLFSFFRGAFVVIILKQKSARTSDLKELFFFLFIHISSISIYIIYTTRSSCEYVKLTYHG